MTTPDPELAILGAGPIGIEAALAAVDAGLDFRIYETAPHAAGSMRRWGHVRLFTPWDLNVSPRMRRHLETASLEVPAGARCPTAHELVDRVLEPLVRLPGIAPRFRPETRVLAVSRERLLKHESIGGDARAAHPFRLLLRGSDGVERVASARTVLDCTGTYEVPNALGDGGIPAPGESALESRILRHIPNPAEEPAVWAGRKLLVVGAGHSAQTAICDLADLADGHAGTEVLWALRSESPRWAIDPEDPLPERSALTARAAALADGASEAVEAIRGVVVDAVRPAGETLEVDLRRADGTIRSQRVDLALSLTGYIGDANLHRQLQVHECYATSGPMKLAAALLGGSADCLAQESHGAETLTGPEPGFFILGIKSYGRTSSFLMRVGWSQVDEVFSLIAPATTAAIQGRTTRSD